MNVDGTNLEDVVDAHLRGDNPTVPSELHEEFARAIAAHEALEYALGETFVVPDAAADERPPPELPDDYEIVRELGRGGMGVVYLVRQKSLGRMVAVKVLRPGESTFGPLVRRFLEEARHLARLRHPNIVGIHEVGHAQDEPYFTMDYVEGESLATILARGRLSPSRALAIFKQAAAGVRHAHEGGIIHRDLKPANILVDGDGNAYVTDFGLARDMTQTSELTRSGEVMGTPAYMAPEQARGQTELIGEATDVHALGAVLYEMLTGKPPYGRDAPADVLLRLLKEEPIAPRRIDRRIPRDLETICLKALEKAPAARYPTMRAFLEDIERYDSGRSVEARRPGRLLRGARLARRHWKLGPAIAGAAAIALAAGALIFGRSVEELIAAGDERHDAGSHSEANELYRSALWRSHGDTPNVILERILRCAQEDGDREDGVDAALEMLEIDPYAWLGEYTYPAAADLVETARERSSGGGSNADLSVWRLAESRLDLALASPYGSESERQWARRTLEDVASRLGREPFALPGDVPGDGLPPGEPATLLRRAIDEGVPRRERARSAYAAAIALERQGKSEEALAAYRLTFEVLSSVHPVYSGLTDGGLSMSQPRSRAREPLESRLLRHALRVIRRLDPEAPETLRGGLRLRVTGLDVAPDLALYFTVSLRDLDLEESADGPRVQDPLSSAPLQLDQTAWIGVADGRYRLAVRRGSSGTRYSDSRGARAVYQQEMMELDFDALPEEVEVRGDVIELLIPARLLGEIRIVEPRQGAEVDLNRDALRWAAFPGAHRHEVRVYEVVVSEFGSVYLHPAYRVECEGASLVLGDVREEIERERPLPAGSSAALVVRAFDSAGRCIGRSGPPRTVFRVARALPAE